MDQDSAAFPLTGDQFDKLIHYVETRIAAAFERPHPSRVASAQEYLDSLKANLRRALVGPEDA
jgi:hypothetical protein